MAKQASTTEDLRNTVIGEVPDDWDVVRLGQFSEKELYIQNGFPCGNWNDQGVGILQIRPFNITNDGKISLSSKKHIETDKPIKNYLLKKKDIIFNNTNSEELVGKTAEWQEDIRAVLSNHMTIIRVLDDKIFDQYFLAVYLHHLWQIGDFNKLCRRHVNQASVSTERLINVAIPHPSLKEQKAISSVLMAIQNAIAGQEALIAKLKELKRSMMNHLFTHGAKGEPTKMTEIGEMPESWEVVQLKEVCEKPKYGFTDSAAETGNVRFLRITDITEDGVDWTTVPFCKCPEPEKYLLKDGDIVFARIGATTGKSYLLQNPDNAVYASYLIRVRANKINSGYLYYFFQTDAYWKQINSQKGTNLKGGVNGSILSQLLVPKCDSPEQVIIAKSFESIDARITVTQSKLSTYQSLFKTLLHELMSGDRRIINYG